MPTSRSPTYSIRLPPVIPVSSNVTSARQGKVYRLPIDIQATTLPDQQHHGLCKLPIPSIETRTASV